MRDRITIDQFSISGFRAYLAEQTFGLSENGKAKSLAVFAPNARGKSSLVDAFEFYFSDDGTLKRLGQRRSGTQAGPEALRHVRTANEQAVSRVSIDFRESDGPFGDSREVADSHSPSARTDAANRVLGACKLSFVIRGYELRHFVDEQTPQERYKDLCRWFELAPLLHIQRNLRALKLRVRKHLEDDPATAERLKDLRTITAGMVTSWDEQDAVEWLNTNYLRPLDPALSLSVLGKDDPAYTTVKLRKEEEEKRIGIDILKSAIAAITAIYCKTADDSGVVKEAGALVDYEHAVYDLQNALKVERQERSRSETAVFRAVWEAAEEVFENGAQDISACPVCDTPLDQTSKEGREQITLHLKGQLASLDTYREAFSAAKMRALTRKRSLASFGRRSRGCRGY